MITSFTQIFIPQAVLEEWSVGENVLVDGDTATLSPGEWQYRLVPAVHLLMCATADDTHDLVGRVRRVQDLRDAGADISGGSVVWGDDVYEGVDGFIGERLDLPEAGASSAGPETPSRESQELEALSHAFLYKA